MCTNEPPANLKLEQLLYRPTIASYKYFTLKVTGTEISYFEVNITQQTIILFPNR